MGRREEGKIGSDKMIRPTAVGSERQTPCSRVDFLAGGLPYPYNYYVLPVPLFSLVPSVARSTVPFFSTCFRTMMIARHKTDIVVEFAKKKISVVLCYPHPPAAGLCRRKACCACRLIHSGLSISNQPSRFHLPLSSTSGLGLNDREEQEGPLSRLLVIISLRQSLIILPTIASEEEIIDILSLDFSTRLRSYAVSASTSPTAN